MRVLPPALLLAVAACGAPADSGAGGASSEAAAPAAMSHDPGPFFHAETAMNDSMRAAVGPSAADTWVRMTIAHHEGEIAMAQVLLAENPSPQAAELARHAIADKPGEIAALRRLLAEGGGEYEAGRPYLPALGRMHDAMMGVDDPDASRAWARKMLHHHRASVEMADVLLARDDVPAAVRRAAETVRARQAGEIAALERLLPAN